jgi:septum formation protein
MLYLKEKFKDTRIILASASPRRKSLLAELGIKFEVIDNCNIEETYPDFLSKTRIPVYLAEKKAAALDILLDERTVIITADTIVWCSNRIMNKPAGRDDAIRMLRELSGNKHQVISGVCIKSRDRQVSFHSMTSVHFRKLTPEDIIYYVDNYRPFDKAGAYGIQEWIGFVGIRSINGSYFNVMGLPVDMLYQSLIDF